MHVPSARADTLPLEIGPTTIPSPDYVGYGQTNNPIFEFYLNAFGENQLLHSIQISITTDGGTPVYQFQMPAVKMFQGSSQVGTVTFTPGVATVTFSSPVSLVVGTPVTFRVLADMGTDSSFTQFMARILSINGNGSVSTTSTSLLSGAFATPFISVIPPNVSLARALITDPNFIIVNGSDQLTISADIVNPGKAAVNLKGMTIGIYADAEHRLLWKPVIVQSDYLLQPGAKYTVSGIKTGTTTLSLLKGERTVFFTLNPDGLSQESSSADNQYTTSITVYQEAPTPPPIISGLTVSTTTATTASVSWVTDILSSALVQYSASRVPVQAFTFQLADTAMATSHLAVIPSLFPGTVYQFRVVAVDRKSQYTLSATSTFTTLEDLSATSSAQASEAQISLKSMVSTPGNAPPVTKKSFTPRTFPDNWFMRIGKFVYTYRGGYVRRIVDDRWLRVQCIAPTRVKSTLPVDIKGIPYGRIITYDIADYDHDGLTAAQEARYGTDPRKADTDGDGYLDGEEVCHGYNPKAKGHA